MTAELDEPLRITLTTDASAPCIRLEGELDPHTAPLLEAALREVGSADAPAIVLDLSSLDFMDSSGLRVIISAHKALEAAGQSLTLRNPSPTISRLLEITNLRAHLHVEDDDA